MGGSKSVRPNEKFIRRRAMQRVVACVLATVLALGSGGCLTVIAVDKPLELDGKRRIIEVEGELYMVDVKDNSVRKLNRDEVHIEVESD
jgi:hypothetical protein